MRLRVWPRDQTFADFARVDAARVDTLCSIAPRGARAQVHPLTQQRKRIWDKQSREPCNYASVAPFLSFSFPCTMSPVGRSVCSELSRRPRVNRSSRKVRTLLLGENHTSIFSQQASIKLPDFRVTCYTAHGSIMKTQGKPTAQLRGILLKACSIVLSLGILAGCFAYGRPL